jgi:tRNA 2-selenouridine synthase
VNAGEIETVVRELLATHYDPGYARSIARNFSQYEISKKIAPVDRSARAMAELAHEILAQAEGETQEPLGVPGI